MISYVLPMITHGGESKPDISQLPEGVAVESFQIREDLQSYDCELTGPPEVLAAIGALTADDPTATFHRCFNRLFVDRFNELCRRLGHDDLTLVEPDVFGIVQWMLENGFGSPGPRPDLD